MSYAVCKEWKGTAKYIGRDGTQGYAFLQSIEETCAIDVLLEQPRCARLRCNNDILVSYAWGLGSGVLDGKELVSETRFL